MSIETSQFLKNIPEIIPSKISMLDANSTIVIFKGTYILKHEMHQIKIDGIIYFDWFPTTGTNFKGKILNNPKCLKKMTIEGDLFSVIVNNLEIGKAFITSYNINVEIIDQTIHGKFSNEVVIGNRFTKVSKIVFSIPNLREFNGTYIKTHKGEKTSISSNRIELEDEELIVKIDKLQDYKDRERLLKRKGGYLLFYSGELTIKNNKYSHEQFKKILFCLNTFLTFINGRRTSALFITGLDEDKEIWHDYTDYFVDTYKTVLYWPQQSCTDWINDLWLEFRLNWENNDNQYFLLTLIHWYVESNQQSGFSEGSIIMAQTALELIYNWWIVENKKINSHKFSKDITAAKKITLIQTQLSINNEIPDGLKHLKKFIKKNANTKKAAEAVVYIRNAIVHSQEKQRKTLKGIDYMVKYEALQLFIWYIELSLLRILSYNSKYFNRCSTEFFLNNREEYVPWFNKDNIK